MLQQALKQTPAASLFHQLFIPHYSSSFRPPFTHEIPRRFTLQSPVPKLKANRQNETLASLLSRLTDSSTAVFFSPHHLI